MQSYWLIELTCSYLLAHCIKHHSVSSASSFQSHQHLLRTAWFYLVKLHLLQVLCGQPSEDHSVIQLVNSMKDSKGSFSVAISFNNCFSMATNITILIRFSLSIYLYQYPVTVIVHYT